MGLIQTVAPTVEPVSLDEAKLWMTEDGDMRNSVILGLIRAARAWCEKHANRQLCTATWQLVMDSFYDQRWTQYGSFSDMRYGKYNSLNNWAIRVPYPPLQAVTSIQYIDPNGNLTTLDPSQYQVDSANEPARIAPAYGIPWPVTRSVMAAVTVTYTAGYGQPADVPDEAKTAIKLLVHAWYDNPSAVGQVPAGLEWTLLNLLSAVDSGEYS